MKYLTILLLLATLSGAAELKIYTEKRTPTTGFLADTSTVWTIFVIGTDTIKMSTQMDCDIEDNQSFTTDIFIFKAIYLLKHEIDSLKAIK